MVLPFAAGIALSDALTPPPVAAVLAALLGAGGFALCARMARRQAAGGRVSRARIAGALCEAALAIALGGLAVEATRRAPPPGVPPDRVGGGAEPLAVAMRVRSPPRPAGTGCQMEVWLGAPVDARADLVGPTPVCVWGAGQLALAQVRLERHRTASNPGGSSVRERRARRGVTLRAIVVSGTESAVPHAPLGVATAVAAVRARLGDVVDPPGRGSRAGGVLRALATGDRGRIPPEVRDAFERAGTAHLLAVSGLHVGLAFLCLRIGVLAALQRAPHMGTLRVARTVALVAGCAGALAYAAVCGLGVPALRAVAMALAGAVALMAGVPASRWNGVAGAALVVLAVDPASLFEAALALSFAAVIGLLAWRPPPGALRGAVHCTLAAGLATAPLVAALGGPVPVGSPLANIVAVPWFGLVVLPGTLLLGLLGLLGPWETAGPWLLRAVELAAELGIRAVEALRSPDLTAGARAPIAVASAAAAAGFALRAAVRGHGRAAAGLAAVALCAAGIAVVREQAPRPAAERLTFLDVGHGDAVLVEAGHAAWLIDAGPRLGDFDAGRSIVLPALRARGIPVLDALVVTHADADHIGGARAVVERVPVSALWMTASGAADPASRPLLRAAAQRGVPLRIVAAGDAAAFGSLSVDVLWPPRGRSVLRRNDGSIVLRVRGPQACAMLPGDIHAEVERALLAGVGACAVLKLAHHGSRTSTTAEWLDRVRPRVAIASAGRRASAPLPHPDVRARLALRDVELLETTRLGAIDVPLDAERIVAIGHRARDVIAPP
jgi:competence protein ComEC